MVSQKALELGERLAQIACDLQDENLEAFDGKNEAISSMLRDIAVATDGMSDEDRMFISEVYIKLVEITVAVCRRYNVDLRHNRQRIDLPVETMRCALENNGIDTSYLSDNEIRQRYDEFNDAVVDFLLDEFDAG